MKKVLVLGLLVVLAFSAISVSAQGESLQGVPLDPATDTFASWGDLDLLAEKAAELGLEGTEVSVFGAIEGVEAAWLQEQVFDVFSEATGINVTYEGSGDFETLIQVRVEGGDEPDIALFPQPGAVVDLAERGEVIPLSEELDQYERDNLIQSWVDLQSVDGVQYMINFNANVKSIVWYPIPEFFDAGYEIPQTWDEMLALSDRIVADGGTPWCIAFESAGATGWPGTDWIEDIMLRTQPPEVYDAWVKNEIPFTDPAVINAFNMFGQIALNPDYVFGGPTAILTTRFQDGANPLFDDPPSCWMHRQASFIAGLWSGGVAGQDADFFYLPPVNEEETGRPVLGGASMAVAFEGHDRPEVQLVMEFMARPLSQELFARQGSFLSPHPGVALEAYPDDLSRRQAEILANADVFRFDGSDLMPAAIGSGAFWTAMVDFVSGESAEDVTAFVQAAWDDLE
ncbi:MAG: carbohydrate ABC transporter substrate-binding protein [Chloroflexi bacterium]|nr:MAG: ABC transporter substrate-binding protein [Phototrophicales bacterium]RMF80721.1 MAG: carbohydrate ABC transporter substrate-binding protein [Chloroflexota bacterium]